MDNLTARIVAKGKNRKKSGGDAKHGRNAKKCLYYRSARYFKNKMHKLQKHIVQHPNDVGATCAKERLWKSAGVA